jgi:DNA-binding CsgD family transcriptional regulator
MPISQFFSVDNQNISSINLENLKGLEMELFFTNDIDLSEKVKHNLEHSIKDNLLLREHLYEVIKHHEHYEFIFLILQEEYINKAIILLINTYSRKFDFPFNFLNTENKVKFTKREKEIINLLLKGKNAKEISEILFIQKRTIEGHQTNLMKKLQVNNTSGIITFCLNNLITI